MKKFLIIFAGLCLLSFVFLGIHSYFFKPFSISVFFEKYFYTESFYDPEFLSRSRILDKYAIRYYDRKWNDYSDEADLEFYKRYKHYAEILQSWNIKNLSPSERISFEILQWNLMNTIKGEKYRHHNYPINQMFGVQNEIPSFLKSIHKIQNEKDAVNYLIRLEEISKIISNSIENLKIRKKKDVVLPTFILKRVIQDLEKLIPESAKEHLLYKDFSDKSSKIFSPVKREIYLEKTLNVLNTSVIPSYRNLLQYLKELQLESNENAGVWKFPDGDAYYQHILKLQTTTDYTPDEIHNIGLAEVFRIQNEMKQILKANGLSQNIFASMAELRKNPKYLYSNDDSGRELCLKDYKLIIDEMETRLLEFFPTIPKSKSIVERIPPFKEKGAPGAYYESPSIDGKRPGIFYANLRNMDEIPKFGMRTLTYHETVPGHHLQIAIQMENENLPTFRRFMQFNAFTEGWALYAEYLAWEYGFQNDPFSNLGRLQAELFRSVRLVVDTGIHSKRWTREKAIRYMLENTGMAVGDVTAEIERYIVMPGQACSYKIGMLKLLELRKQLKTKMGDSFDIRVFHDQVLRNGAMPLSVLSNTILNQN